MGGTTHNRLTPGALVRFIRLARGPSGIGLMPPMCQRRLKVDPPLVSFSPCSPATRSTRPRFLRGEPTCDRYARPTWTFCKPWIGRRQASTGDR